MLGEVRLALCFVPLDHGGILWLHLFGPSSVFVATKTRSKQAGSGPNKRLRPGCATTSCRDCCSCMSPGPDARDGISFCSALVRGAKKNMSMFCGYFMTRWILFGTYQLKKMDKNGGFQRRCLSVRMTSSDAEKIEKHDKNCCETLELKVLRSDFRQSRAAFCGLPRPRRSIGRKCAANLAGSASRERKLIAIVVGRTFAVL